MRRARAPLCPTLARLGAALACVSAAACRRGMQSALDPAGPQARRIENLWWLFFYVCAAVFVLVMVWTLAAVYRARVRRRETATALDVTDEPELAPAPQTERALRNVVVGATALTVVILFVFLVASFVTGRALWEPADRTNQLTVEVTGQQWWWKVRYLDAANAQNVFTTANEIHIPTNTPVTFKLQAPDVIHSFWVPNLMGKKDLIPGQIAYLWLQADRPGTYRGQCAEYCGMQHAHMAFYVVAEPPEQFAAWLTRQRMAAAQPASASAQRGQQVFMNAPCVMCHTIRGTQAGSGIGPDLTHVGSRTTIAAGTLPNERGHLANWVADAQSVKPGSRMPPNSLSPEDLQALLDYLQSLQ
ncbi:MAG TPA: cytochrome c oxidase subunit II [Pyrinomonadaceae bacterium]|jgi:cytochrome c oxidase subunit 2